MSDAGPFDYSDLLAYGRGDQDRAAPDVRVSRRRLLRLMAAGGALGAGMAVFGAGFLTRSLTERSSSGSVEDTSRVVAQLLPEEGFAIDAPWGDVMPRLIQFGVVDVAKFNSAISSSGSTPTEEQQRILAGSSDENVSIDRSNGRFVLNALWALGLANRNPLLTDGPMATLDETRRARLASTAGWTLGEESGPQYLAQFDVVPLTGEQQAILEEVAYNTYRPCCDNPTAFPDCNHGAAALALAEMAAAEGASAAEIFAALKGFNSFWYPQQYYVLSVYFERRGQAWDELDPRIVLGPQFSSGSGWKRVAAEVQQQGLPGQVPGGSSGCGV